MVVGCAVVVAAGVAVGQLLYTRVQTVRAATAWAIGANAALLVGGLILRFRQAVRPVVAQRLLQLVGSIAGTLFFAGFTVMFRTDSRFVRHPVSAPLQRFGSVMLLGFIPFLVVGLVMKAWQAEGTWRKKSDLAPFLISGWPDGDDRTPRARWGCDETFETFDAALTASRSWLSTQPKTAEVEVMEDHGRELVVVAIITRHSVTQVERS
jgi:hypothetical protein